MTQKAKTALQAGNNSPREAFQKYITFSLGEEEYGIPVLQVNEIVKIQSIIKIPHAFNYFIGLIDIRGSVIPLIDLKKKLGLEFETETVSRFDRAIIVQAEGRKIALAVDRVSHVIRLTADSIDSGPPVIKSASNKYIAGIGKYRDQFIVLMNLETLFSPEEVDFIYITQDH